MGRLNSGFTDLLLERMSEIGGGGVECFVYFQRRGAGGE